ncbi:SDR family NAD(P)-dependent oxidoreductase [Magnetovibrio sp.]|uniref:SDR family NAD(P)-dependent oxidoreductase n=1 Tax=Magnetovibrio sp. TaxID=2024836 RepID=UPI002F928570
MIIDGKVFVVTGAGSGIGRALAQNLSKQGARLVLADLNADGLQTTQAALDHPGHARCVTGDITKNETRQAIIATAVEAFGGIDALVNNAGVVAVGPLAKAEDAALELMVRVNLLAPMLLVRDVLPTLEKSDCPTIVNVGSMFGDIAFPLFAGYSASKFGVRGLSDALRRELAPKNITVTYIAPRAAKTGATGAFEHLIEPMKMKLDEPEKVAQNIADAIRRGARSSYPKGAERLFVLIQRIAPKLVDNSIIAQLKSLKS